MSNLASAFPLLTCYLIDIPDFASWRFISAFRRHSLGGMGSCWTNHLMPGSWGQVLVAFPWSRLCNTCRTVDQMIEWLMLSECHIKTPRCALVADESRTGDFRVPSLAAFSAASSAPCTHKKFVDKWYLEAVAWIDKIKIDWWYGCRNNLHRDSKRIFRAQTISSHVYSLVSNKCYIIDVWIWIK